MLKVDARTAYTSEHDLFRDEVRKSSGRDYSSTFRALRTRGQCQSRALGGLWCRGRNLDETGHRSSETSGLLVADVQVPEAHVLGIDNVGATFLNRGELKHVG